MRNRHTKNKRDNGFTIIEIIIVIVVIGTLAGIIGVSYSGWKQSASEAQLKSDLSGAATAMEDYRTYNNNYPSSVPSSFTPSQGVTLTVHSSNGGGYCIEALGSETTAKYHISSFTNEASSGDCSYQNVLNLATDYSTWTLAGGATYDPSAGVLTLGHSGNATSPLIRVYRPTNIIVNGEFYATTASPYAGFTPNGAWFMNIYYFGSDGTTPVFNTSGYASNGCAKSFLLNQWSSSSSDCTFYGGPNVEAVKYTLYGSSSGYTSPGLIIRSPVLKTAY